MYLRPAFTETDLDRIAGLIRDNPFGLLTTHGPEGLDASHIPFAVERDGDTLMLTGHLAAANAQCGAIAAGVAALAVFSGPHAYISPSWYVTRPAVPTWDYAAAHVHGVLEPMAEDADMATSLHALATHDPAQFDVDALEDKYRQMMFKGIRAFRLRATRVEAQWKMSQNRSIADRQSVIAALRPEGRDAVADLIAETLRHHAPPPLPLRTGPGEGFAMQDER